MAKESTYQAIILKKQPYGEADELVTVFSRQAGKLRFLGKSTKLARSKLQYSLQSLFMVRLTVAGSRLPQVIGAEVLNSFAGLRQNYQAAKMALYAQEVVIKATADEQRNELLFLALADFLRLLDVQSDEPALNAGLAKFKIAAAEALGFSISADPQTRQYARLNFSNSRGGFLVGDNADSVPVSGRVLEQFLFLANTPFGQLAKNPRLDLAELQLILAGFLEYQLERDIKTSRLLGL